MRILMLAALVACGTPADTNGPLSGTSPDPGVPTTGSTTGTVAGTPAGTGTEPTSTWACRSDVDDADLNGNYPPVELELPDFTAYNSDGSERHKPDLQSHVTVLWFYPAAGTAG